MCYLPLGTLRKQNFEWQTFLSGGNKLRIFLNLTKSLGNTIALFENIVKCKEKKNYKNIGLEQRLQPLVQTPESKSSKTLTLFLKVF